jgi:hypothetical protein
MGATLGLDIELRHLLGRSRRDGAGGDNAGGHQTLQRVPQRAGSAIHPGDVLRHALI